MKKRGFVVYDIFDINYRPLDGSASQADLLFVKETSRFRKYRFFATAQQRKKLNTRYAKYFADRQRFIS